MDRLGFCIFFGLIAMAVSVWPIALWFAAITTAAAVAGLSFGLGFVAASFDLRLS